MRTVEVCVSPDLIPCYKLEGKIVVVIDILRATSCMVTGLGEGLAGIIPVEKVEECQKLKDQGYIAAAERDGKKVEGFDIGNSPFSYQDAALKGKWVAVTTTNGTRALIHSCHAKEILVGAFLNRAALVKYLLSKEEDIVLVCAGWKGQLNVEDTLYAGAIIESLEGKVKHSNDSALIALHLYEKAKGDMLGFLGNSSHLQRLKNLGIEEDIKYCLKEDLYDVVPQFIDGKLLPVLLTVEK
ncbi:MAG: 2-phosphosulfolactate phosphatase [Chitinophagaceae bacterium]|nr:2-phosphosulfolactate phosphatase [Chitinophagaceae bacterium]